MKLLHFGGNSPFLKAEIRWPMLLLIVKESFFAAYQNLPLGGPNYRVLARLFAFSFRTWILLQIWQREMLIDLMCVC